MAPDRMRWGRPSSRKSVSPISKPVTSARTAQHGRQSVELRGVLESRADRGDAHAGVEERHDIAGVEAAGRDEAHLREGAADVAEPADAEPLGGKGLQPGQSE